eukprot:2833865-Amphidinium_carterae.1
MFGSAIGKGKIRRACKMLLDVTCGVLGQESTIDAPHVIWEGKPFKRADVPLSPLKSIGRKLALTQGEALLPLTMPSWACQPSMHQAATLSA